MPNIICLCFALASKLGLSVPLYNTNQALNHLTLVLQNDTKNMAMPYPDGEALFFFLDRSALNSGAYFIVSWTAILND